MVVLDTTFMNVSITALVKDLNTTVDSLQAATALNALFMAVFVLMGDKKEAVLGKKRSFPIGMLNCPLHSYLPAWALNCESLGRPQFHI